MKHYHSPGDFFSYPRVFWVSVRAPDSVRTGQWFEPRPSTFFCWGGGLYGFYYSTTFFFFFFSGRQVYFLWLEHYISSPSGDFSCHFFFFSNKAVGMSPVIYVQNQTKLGVFSRALPIPEVVQVLWDFHTRTRTQNFCEVCTTFIPYTRTRNLCKFCTPVPHYPGYGYNIRRCFCCCCCCSRINSSLQCSPWSQDRLQQLWSGKLPQEEKQNKKQKIITQ